MAATRTFRTIILLALAAAACGGGDGGEGRPQDAGGGEARPNEGPVAMFALARSSCSYEGPTVVAAGDATFALTSRGGTADFDLWLLEDGHTYEELAAHIDEERRRSEQGRPPLGHPSFATLVAEASTDSGGQGTLAAALQPGVYGTACIRFGEQHRPGGLWAAGPFTVEA